MKKTFLSIFLAMFTTVGFTQTTEQINPSDPNYNIELNAILQTVSSQITGISRTVNKASSLTGLVLPVNGGTGVDSSNWTSGDVVFMSSTGTWGHTTYAPSKFVPNSIQVFTSSANWPTPAGITSVYVKVWGDGGGGQTHTGSGTGGPGGYAEGITAISGIISITVGQGGLESGSSGGGNGTGSSFVGVTTISSTGGTGAPDSNGSKGAAGIGTGIFTLTGSAGQTNTGVNGGLIGLGGVGAVNGNPGEVVVYY